MKHYTYKGVPPHLQRRLLILVRDKAIHLSLTHAYVDTTRMQDIDGQINPDHEPTMQLAHILLHDMLAFGAMEWSGPADHRGARPVELTGSGHGDLAEALTYSR